MNVHVDITEPATSATGNFELVCQLHTAASELRVCWAALMAHPERDLLLEDAAHMVDNLQSRFDRLAEKIEERDIHDFQASYLLRHLLEKASSMTAQYVAASDPEEAADLLDDLPDLNNQILETPAGTLADVRAKAAHVLRMIETGLDPIGQDGLLALLRSFSGRASG